MPSIQNTIIEFNFTLLSGRIYKNKAKSEEDIMLDIHILPSFRDSYHPMFPIRVPVHYTHPIWLVVKHQQVTVARYAKV